MNHVKSRSSITWWLVLFVGSKNSYRNDFLGCTTTTVVVDAFTTGITSTKKQVTTIITNPTSLNAIKLPFLTTSSSSSSSSTNQKPMIPTKSKLTPIQRLKIQQFNNDDEEEEEEEEEGVNNNNKLSKFDQFKSMLYTVRDTTKMATEQPGRIGRAGNKNKNRNTNKVYDGFNSKDSSLVMKPGLSTVFTTMTTAFRLPFQKVEPLMEVEQPTKSSSWFDTLKGTVYNTADMITNSASTSKSTTKLPPAKRVSTSFIVKSSSSTVDPFTRLKEGLYTMNDIISKAIETVPTIPKKVEQTSQKTLAFVTKTIPDRAQETVNTVVSIPNRMEQTFHDIQSTIENQVDHTKQLIQSMQSIPDQVQESVVTTQKSMNHVQESIEDVTSSIQVQLGLRQPKVQPPKQVPPSIKSTATDVLMDVTWSGTKTIGTMMGKSILWIGQTSFDLAKYTMEDAIQKQKTTSDIDTSLLSSLSTNSNDKKSTITSFNIDENDILATLQLAEEAIALAAEATTEKTMTTTVAPTDLNTNIPNKVDLTSSDDSLDIMATLQMANDAIALAESVTKSNDVNDSVDQSIVNNSMG